MNCFAVHLELLLLFRMLKRVNECGCLVFAETVLNPERSKILEQPNDLEQP